MLIFNIIAAFLAATLSGLGVGSGGLLVIYLTLIVNVAQRTAQGINLLFFLFSGGAALAVHCAHRKLYLIPILILTVFGIGGSLLGANLAGLLPPTLLRRLFGGMLVISGLLTLRRVKARQSPTQNASRHRFR